MKGMPGIIRMTSAMPRVPRPNFLSYRNTTIAAGHWHSFYDVDCIVEFGSGYGTFTLPVSRISDGFMFLRDQDLSECCPYHYGMLLMRSL
jgi:hypothetical protein